MQYRGNTAAEIIYNRANHKKEHMGLTSWEGIPNSKIHKYDVVIAKNYLSKNEIAQLERMVSAYLDLAEMAKLHEETEFEKYRIIQDRIYISDFDQLIIESQNLKKEKSKS